MAVVALLQPDRAILTVRAEHDADKLRRLSVPAMMWRDDLDHETRHEHFRGADVVLVLPEDSAEGWGWLYQVASTLSGIAGRIRTLRLPEGGASAISRGELHRLIDSASDWKPVTEPANPEKAAATMAEQALIDELARLGPFDYDRRRREAADELGIRRGTLDGQVGARRSELADGGPAQSSAPPLHPHWGVTPLAEPVDGAALVSALQGRLQRFVVLADAEALIVACWILLTWIHEDVVTFSPILMITSIEQGSGKTTLGDLVKFLVFRGLGSVGINPSGVFRLTDSYKPTLILDEADKRLRNDDLREVINSGWTRGTGVLRYDPAIKMPRLFQTFSPKVIIGKDVQLDSTTWSRTIVIHMKRRKASEAVEWFRHVDDDESNQLRQRCLRFASENGEVIKAIKPALPESFENRLAGNFEVLFAIADHIGGDLPERVRAAATRVSRVEIEGSVSDGVRLLIDIARILTASSATCLASNDLVRRLKEDDESGPFWSEWRAPGTRSPLTANTLARLLRPYGVIPRTIWPVKGRSARGYLRSVFTDAFERYLPRLAQTTETTW